jgi:hypothetical protein
MLELVGADRADGFLLARLEIIPVIYRLFYGRCFFGHSVILRRCGGD